MNFENENTKSKSEAAHFAAIFAAIAAHFATHFHFAHFATAGLRRCRLSHALGRRRGSSSSATATAKSASESATKFTAKKGKNKFKIWNCMVG